MFKEREKPDILNGKVVPTLFKLGWPIMIGSLLQSAYNLTDTYWLGNMGSESGKEALAAMQASWPLIWFLMSVGMGFGIAALALVSQHTGAGNLEEANEDAGQLLLFFLIFSILMGITGYFTSPALVGSIIQDSDVAYQGQIYMQTIFLGIPFMFIFMGFMFLLQGWGDTVTPMILTIISVGANIILDPLMIYGVGIFPEWGIFGAAFATVISRIGASAVAIYLLFSGKVGINIKFKHLKPNFQRLKKYVKIGIPASIGNSGTAFGFVIMMFIIARVERPIAALAAYAAGDRILGLMFIVMGGLAVATSTMVGQNLGADQKSRAEDVVKKGILTLVLLMTIFSIVLFLFSSTFITIFNQDPEVIEIGKEFLLIFSFSMPFFGIFRAVGAIHEGAGQTIYQMGMDLTRLWALRVPLSIILAFVVGWQAAGVWVGMAASNIVAAGFALYILSLGRWKHKVIEKVEKSPYVPEVVLDKKKEVRVERKEVIEDLPD